MIYLIYFGNDVQFFDRTYLFYLLLHHIRLHLHFMLVFFVLANETLAGLPNP